MRASLRARVGGISVALAFTALISSPALTGCSVDHRSPDPRIELEETDTLRQSCGGALSRWTVTNRETHEVGTAGCEQPVLFVSLTPGASYTFDIAGYAGQRTCWQGSCQVTAVAGTTTYGECSRSITELCGD